MQLIGARFGQYADVRTAGVSLRGVIHRGIPDRDFLDSVGRRGRQGLANGAIHGGVGLKGATRPETLPDVKREAVLTH